MTTTRQPKQNYCQIIMAHLMAGKTITIWESISLYQITCLAQRISDLRAVGAPIQDKWVKQNGKRFKRYWIDQPANTTKSEVIL